MRKNAMPFTHTGAEPFDNKTERCLASNKRAGQMTSRSLFKIDGEVYTINECVTRTGMTKEQFRAKYADIRRSGKTVYRWEYFDDKG